MDALLKTEGYKIVVITYVKYINPEFFSVDLLKFFFDVIILKSQKECGVTLSRELVNIRNTLIEFVEKGGKLIVLKDACSKTYSDQKTSRYRELRDS